MKQVAFKPLYVLLGIENNEGEGAALPATSVLRTIGATTNIGINGDINSHAFDGATANEQLNTADTETARQSELLFSTPWAYPDVLGTTGPLDVLLRLCGYDVIYDAANQRTHYVASDLDAIDSGHFAMRADRSEGKETSYESKGARGTFDLKIEPGKKLMLENVRLLGAYVRPDENAIIEPDQQTALSNVGAGITVRDIYISINDKHVCIESLVIKNISGLDLYKISDSCEESATFALNTNPTGSIKYHADFESKFNPFERAELASNNVISITLNSPGLGSFILELNTQLFMPNRVEFADKSSGFEQSFKCLAVPSLTVENEIDLVAQAEILQWMRDANAVFTFDCNLMN